MSSPSPIEHALIRPARGADAPAIARIHVDAWREAYAGIVSANFLAALSYERRERAWQSALEPASTQAILFVAEDPAGNVIGFVSAGPNGDPALPHRGEVSALYLLARHHRQGIGRALFTAATGALAARGMSSWLVWVLAEGPARPFYAAMGGHLLREKTVQIGDQTLMDVAYAGAARDQPARARAEASLAAVVKALAASSGPRPMKP